MSWVQAYHKAKNAWSEAYALANHRQRALLPPAFNVWQAAEWVSKLPYTGDPLGGLVDFYQHPERVQYHMERGSLGTLRVDCDESLYAYALLKGGAGEPRLLCLIDGAGIQWEGGKPYNWTHVICRCDQGAAVYTIDTNGLIRHESEAAILYRFSELYPRARYTHVEEIPPPWRGRFRYRGA